MKKSMILILILSLLLCGCAAGNSPETTAPSAAAPEETSAAPTAAAPTEASTEAPEEVPTEAPEEVPTEAQPEVIAVPVNPLTGETLEAPLDSRTFAVSINNIQAAMPMYGVSQADIFFEMFVNDYCTRGLALFADIRQVGAVGSVRSMRYNFTDLCLSYDALMAHASGSAQVLADVAASGVDDISVEIEGGNYFFRDRDRNRAGHAWEHCLFVKGRELMEKAASKGYRVTPKENADYGLRFAEDGTPEGGEAAADITVNLTHGAITKKTVMKYDADRGAYLFHQFGKAMHDAYLKEDIFFENVIVMFCTVENESVYHVADLLGSGEGFFACGGRIIPIRWSHESMDQPILFTHTDGTPLELGVGSSYIAIAPLTSTVQWE